MTLAARRVPVHTWIGAAILFVAESGVVFGIPLIVTWLTPLAWTGYILAVDGIVARLSGRSWLTSRCREFAFLVLASIGIWLIFEAYNFHLRNWFYLGVPPNPIVRDFAYAWSFATIAPGIFETVDLIRAVLRRRSPTAAPTPGPATSLRSAAWILAGLAMVTIPLAVPPAVAAYLFGAVWLGFFFLADPITEMLGAPSLMRSWRQGDRWPVGSLLIAGFLCGLLWETWNYQAYLAGGGHWVYTVPQPLRVLGLHFGQMPVLGLLGFPPFALELFAMYQFLRRILGIDRFTLTR